MKHKPAIAPLVWRVAPLALLLVLIAALIYVSIPGAAAPAAADLAAPRAEAQQAPIAAGAAAPVLKLPGAAPAAATAPTEVTESIQGAVVTQTFVLHEGWNAIYLGVEPVNPSGLVDPNKPELGYKLSLIEAVLGGVAGLESAWTYNQPVTHKDYIIDPGEGLWDAPGWDRYIPEGNVGPDGQSREFLSTLTTLHANTGYLVKMKPGASGAVQVTGKPLPGHHRWKAGAYNLAGFPLTAGGATVATFTTGSPITEVRGLTAEGTWTAAFAGTDVLLPSVAYLVRYAEEPPAGQAPTPDYTAPLDIDSLPSEGLVFQAGLQGQAVELVVRNASDKQATVTLRLPQGAGTAVALNYVTDTAADLRNGSVSFALAAGEGRHLKFQAPVADQPAAGETLLEILSPELGTLWRLPVAAQPGSYAGLWVGDVIVNNVSEARLGATNFDTDLTVSLAQTNDSDVHGSTQIRDVQQGASHTLFFTVTLTLPDLTLETVQPTTPGGLFARGHVFVDQNQNGQHDVTEPGLRGAEVNVGSSTTLSDVDGSYLVAGLTEGDYDLAAGGSVLDGYTSAFAITVPATAADANPIEMANSLPATVTLGPDGATAVGPSDYLYQVIYQRKLPYYDAYDNRAEPPLNFGYVREDSAAVYSGTCTAPGSRLFDVGSVKNGSLQATVPGHSLSELTGSASHILITWKGQPVACADLVAGAPTQSADGRGTEARFRVILRVSKSQQVALLPYYALDGDKRVSSVVFLSMQQPITVTGPFGVVGAGLEYNLTLAANDPLNPYKHKYNPDHDNLDAKFTGTQEESFDVLRKVTFILSALPHDNDAAAAAAIDWGGAVWGGEYREVVDNLHQSSITARGYFVIRHVLTADELVKQEYDR